MGSPETRLDGSLEHNRNELNNSTNKSYTTGEALEATYYAVRMTVRRDYERAALLVRPRRRAESLVRLTSLLAILWGIWIVLDSWAFAENDHLYLEHADLAGYDPLAVAFALIVTGFGAAWAWTGPYNSRLRLFAFATLTVTVGWLWNAGALVLPF